MIHVYTFFQCEENEGNESQFGDHKKDGQAGGTGTMSASEPDLTQQVS